MAELHLGLIAKKRTPKAILVALEQLPEELDQVYENIMERIRGQDKDDVDLAEKLLMWITFSKELLSSSALQHAVAVTSGCTDINDGDLIPVQELISISAGMVTLDKESGIIRLVHYTTQTYLQIRLKNAQAAMALTCITYLGFNVFDTPCLDRSSVAQRKQKYALSRYAARYWGEHTRGDPENHLYDVIVATFHGKEKRHSMAQVRYSSVRSANHSLLHIVCVDGLATICERLLFVSNEAGRVLRGEEDIEAKDIHGKTPFSMTVMHGPHIPVMKLLVEAGANINAKDGMGRTPLASAAVHGKPEFLKILLETGADIEAKDADGRTPFALATKRINRSIASLLLDAGANIEAKDQWGKTPLAFAAHSGGPEMVRLLLDAGADIEAADKYGRTLLNLVALNVYGAEIARLLLDAGANIEAKDQSGRTPLVFAALSGGPEMVRLLLDAGADIEAADEYGRTPLNLVALNIHGAEMARLLLDAGADIEAKDRVGRTPLAVAASAPNSKLVLVRLLVEAGANLEAVDKLGYTPLQRAEQNNKTDIVKLLQELGENHGSPAQI